MPKTPAVPTAIAILCITLLEAVALANKIDGALLSVVVALIAGLGGYSAKEVATLLSKK